MHTREREYTLGGYSRARVLVATLSGRINQNGFADRREAALVHALGHGISVATISVEECRIDLGRNYVVEECLKAENPQHYIVFFDDDMAIPEGIIPRLVVESEENDADVVGCLYTGRGFPAVPIVEPPGGGTCSAALAKELHDINGIVEVGAVGFGCTLVRTSIFKKLTKPYFFMTEAGEDWNFCHAVKAAGGKVVCDFGVTSEYRGKTYPGVAHLGVYPYSLKDSECT